MSIWSKFVSNGGNVGQTFNTSGTIGLGTQVTTLAAGSNYFVNASYNYGGIASFSILDKKYSEVVCENIIKKFLPILIHIQSDEKNVNLICDMYLKIIDLLPDDADFEKAVDRNKIIFELLNNGEATWVLYLKHENDYISNLAELFIYHIKE